MLRVGMGEMLSCQNLKGRGPVQTVAWVVGLGLGNLNLMSVPPTDWFDSPMCKCLCALVRSILETMPFKPSQGDKERQAEAEACQGQHCKRHHNQTEQLTGAGGAGWQGSACGPSGCGLALQDAVWALWECLVQSWTWLFPPQATLFTFT